MAPPLHAVATRYHAGQLNAQLGIQEPLLVHVGIVSRVMPAARRSADLNWICAICSPRQTPQTAGSKKRSRQNRESDSTRNLARQNKQGAKDNTALTRTVRRDIDPMTNPPVQDQAIKRKTLHSSNVKPGPTVSPVALKMVGCMSR